MCDLRASSWPRTRAPGYGSAELAREHYPCERCPYDDDARAPDHRDHDVVAYGLAEQQGGIWTAQPILTTSPVVDPEPGKIELLLTQMLPSGPGRKP